MSSPSSRSLKHLREKGWQVAMVEKWNPYARIRQDVWGFADAVGCITELADGECKNDWPQPRIAFSQFSLFQFTSTPNMAAREAKIRASKEAAYWCKCGGKIYLLGWAKRGPRDKRKVWTLTEREIQI